MRLLRQEGSSYNAKFKEISRSVNAENAKLWSEMIDKIVHYSVMIGHAEVELVEDFCYLASNISRLGNCDNECTMRIEKSSVFRRLASSEHMEKQKHQSASNSQVV